MQLGERCLGPANGAATSDLTGRFVGRLSQPVGQSYEYANDNYNLLGLIIQAVSGISYEEYVRSAIYAPLEMSHSAACDAISSLPVTCGAVKCSASRTDT